MLRRRFNHGPWSHGARQRRPHYLSHCGCAYEQSQHQIRVLAQYMRLFEIFTVHNHIFPRHSMYGICLCLYHVGGFRGQWAYTILYYTFIHGVFGFEWQARVLARRWRPMLLSDLSETHATSTAPMVLRKSDSFPKNGCWFFDGELTTLAHSADPSHGATNTARSGEWWRMMG